MLVYHQHWSGVDTRPLGAIYIVRSSQNVTVEWIAIGLTDRSYGSGSCARHPQAGDSDSSERDRGTDRRQI